MKNKKIIITIIISAVLVLAGGFGTAFAMFDAFKSAKLVYLEAELQDSKNRKEFFSETFQSYNEYVQQYLSQPVHTEFELSDVKVDSPLIDEESAKVLELINDSKIVISNDSDEKNKKSFVSFELFIKNDPFIGFEMFRNDNTIGFGVPELYKKYAFLNLDDSESIKDQFGVEELPKKYVTYEDVMAAVKISEEELKPIVKEYAKLYANSIEDLQVKLVKDATFEEEDSKIKSREITVTFNEKQLKKLSKSIADKMASDKALLDILYTRYKNVSELMNDSGTEFRIMDKDDFLHEVEEAHEEFINSLEEVELNEDIVMTLYIDRNDNVLERKIEIDTQDEYGDDMNVILKYANWMLEDNVQNHLLSIKTKSSYSNGEFKWTYSAKETKDKTEGEVAFIIEDYSDNSANFLLELESDFTTVTANEKTTSDISFKASAKEYDEDLGTLKGSVKSETVSNKDSRNADYKVSLDFSDVSNDELKEVSFNIKTVEQFGKEVKLPELSEENSLNIAKLTEDELVKVQDELMTAFEQFATKNEELFAEFESLSESIPASGLYDFGDDYDDYYGEYEDDSTDVMDNTYWVESVIDSYEWAMIDAINYQDFSMVEYLLIPDSNMYYSQQELVQNLAESGITEELVNYEVVSVEPGYYENEYFAYVNETITIYYADGTSETNDYSWVYTVYMDDVTYGIMDIQAW